jgi:hypothetical protein
MRYVLLSIFLLAGLIPCYTGLLFAQQRAYTPTVGSAERKALLDALRCSVQQEIKTPVVFKVDHMKVQDGWAFIRGVPQQPSGKPLSYSGTRYKTAIEEGFFDDWFCALLQKQQGKWKVVTYEIGATDVPYLGWEQQYHAPPGIFK